MWYGGPRDNGDRDPHAPPTKLQRDAATVREANPDSDQEEWDRHEAWHVVENNTHYFRTHTTQRTVGTNGILAGNCSGPLLMCDVWQEYLFDDWRDCPNPWDKQDNSGIVLWTDGVYWDQLKGGFDERYADDWDVDPEQAQEVDVYVTQPVPMGTTPLTHCVAGTGLEACQESLRRRSLATTRVKRNLPAVMMRHSAHCTRLGSMIASAHRASTSGGSGSEAVGSAAAHPPRSVRVRRK